MADKQLTVKTHFEVFKINTNVFFVKKKSVAINSETAEQIKNAIVQPNVERENISIKIKKCNVVIH